MTAIPFQLELETWRPVKDFPYVISNLGRVRRTIKSRGNGRGGLIITPHILPNGYHYARIYDNGRKREVSIHRLVVECFYGEIPEGMEVNHIDGRKDNNSLSNLEVVTHQKNQEHASRFCLMNKHRVINEDAAKVIKWFIKKCPKYSLARIAKAYGVSKNVVKDISRNKSWKYVELNR